MRGVEHCGQLHRQSAAYVRRCAVVRRRQHVCELRRHRHRLPLVLGRLVVGPVRVDLQRRVLPIEPQRHVSDRVCVDAHHDDHNDSDSDDDDRSNIIVDRRIDRQANRDIDQRRRIVTDSDDIAIIAGSRTTPILNFNKCC